MISRSSVVSRSSSSTLPETVVDALAPKAGEVVLRKTQASAFFGTHLNAVLVAKGVDTLIVTGCTTSGCVRASVLDAMSCHYRTVVVTD